jgi:hypothetical protein
MGPTGPTGAASTIPGPQGPAGQNGLAGSNGINTFTTLTTGFVQPGPNFTVEIFVVNNSWMAVDQIIFIGPSASTDSGGFYRVVDTPTLTSVEVMRMDWIIPDVAFEITGQTVGAVGTIVTPSGTIGPDGFPGSFIQESFWGIESGTGGSNDYKYGILVPGNTLLNNYDVLECKTIICIESDVSSLIRITNIKVSTTNDNSGVNAIEFVLRNTVNLPGKPVTYAHINYKIQRISATTFRSSGECFIGDEEISAVLLTQTSSNNYICTSTSAIALDGSSNWTNNQYIVVVANDEDAPAGPSISVRHHEVKVTRVKI